MSRQKVRCNVQVPWNVNCSQRKKPVLSPKEEAACMPVEGARLRASLAIYMGHHCHVVCPDNDMTAHQGREKMILSQRDGSQLKAIYVPREKLAHPNTARRSALEDCTPNSQRGVSRDSLATANYTHRDPLK
ncbi:hypothetical protein PO909_033877 [Leuciscus waleckii]